MGADKLDSVTRVSHSCNEIHTRSMKSGHMLQEIKGKKGRICKYKITSTQYKKLKVLPPYLKQLACKVGPCKIKETPFKHVIH